MKSAEKHAPSTINTGDGWSPTNPTLWERCLEVARGDKSEFSSGQRTIHAPNNGRGFDSWPSPNGTAWAVKQYNGFGGAWKKGSASNVTSAANIVTDDKLSKSWLMGIRRGWLSLMKPTIKDWDDVQDAGSRLKAFVANFKEQVLFVKRSPGTVYPEWKKGAALRKALETFEEEVYDAVVRMKIWRDAAEQRGHLIHPKEDGERMFDLYQKDFPSAATSGYNKELVWYLDKVLAILREDILKTPLPEADTVYKEFDIHGMKVVVDDKTVTSVEIEHYAKFLKEAYARMKAKGVGKAWYGTVFIDCESCGGENSNTSGGVGAHYLIKKDVIRIYERPSSWIVELMAHELGHRYWFRQMTSEQRARFESFVRTAGPRPVDDEGRTKWRETLDTNPKPVAPVSDYGATHIDEAFAEAFAHYVIGKDMTRDQIDSFKSVLVKNASRRLSSEEQSLLVGARSGATLITSPGTERHVRATELGRYGYLEYVCPMGADSVWEVSAKGNVALDHALGVTAAPLHTLGLDDVTYHNEANLDSTEFNRHVAHLDKVLSDAEMWQTVGLRVVLSSQGNTVYDAQEHVLTVKAGPSLMRRQAGEALVTALAEGRSLTAALGNDLKSKMEGLLDRYSPEDAAKVGEWIEDTFRTKTPKTPPGGKVLKDDLQKIVWCLKHRVSQSAEPEAISRAHEEIRDIWKDLSPHVDKIVRMFSDEGASVVPKSLTLGGVEYENEVGFTEENLTKYAKRLQPIFSAFTGWRKKALDGKLVVVLAAPSSFPGTAGGKYKSELDKLLVRATPKILSRSGGSYGSLEYVITHELGHRYEWKQTLPTDFERFEWVTTPYSKKETERFAELFALGHFGIKGQWDPAIQEKFEALMSGSAKTAARPLKPEKIQELLTKVRKQSVDAVKVELLAQVLMSLGEWRIYPSQWLNPKASNPQNVSTFRSPNPNQVKGHWDRVKSEEVSSLPDPASATLHKTVTMDVSPIEGDSFTYRAWQVDRSTTFKAPNGATFEAVLAGDQLDKQYARLVGSVEKGVYLAKWLKDSTPFYEQVNERLSLPSIEEEKAEKERQRRSPESKGATCPACFGWFKIEDRKGPVMTFHGYRRPGTGRTHGECFGRGWAPYELSADGTEAYLKTIEDQLKSEQAFLDRVPNADKLHYANREIFKDKVTPEEWQKWLGRVIDQSKDQIEFLEELVKKLKGKISSWVYRPEVLGIEPT